MGERRAKLLRDGNLPAPDRTGLFTTAILSRTSAGQVALFYSGRNHAGENLNRLLHARDPALEPPILMSAALSRNIPKNHAVIEANCIAHARRGLVDQFPNFPVECRTLLEMLRAVFVVEARCKERKLSSQERLLAHQAESRPVLEKLHALMSEQLENKHVEPNSGLGKAYEYMLKRWDKPTLFLRQPGAPIDNNSCERSLKMAIAHRRNALFFRSQHGASVGDMFTSLIHCWCTEPCSGAGRAVPSSRACQTNPNGLLASLLGEGAQSMVVLRKRRPCQEHRCALLPCRFGAPAPPRRAGVPALPHPPRADVARGPHVKARPAVLVAYSSKARPHAARGRDRMDHDPRRAARYERVGRATSAS